MVRFEDSSDLFGVSGCSTDCEITCGWCGTIHNEGISEPAYASGAVSVCYTNFGGTQICDCCFEKIENSVIAWLPTIIPWFIRMVKAKAKQVSNLQRIIHALKETIGLPENDNS